MKEPQKQNVRSSRDLKNRELRIKFLRTLFAAAIIISSVGFVGSLIFSAVKPKKAANPEVVNGDKLIIEKPTFIGHSLENGRVTVTADEAKRKLGGEQSDIELKNPVFKSQFGSQITALNGIWNEARQELILENQVQMAYANGDKAFAQSAYYGQIANPDGKGFKLSAPIVFLNKDVKFIRKSGETIDSNIGLWEDREQQLSLGANVNIAIPKIASDNNNHVDINFKQGSAHSNGAIFQLNNNVIFGSGNVGLQFGKISATSETYEFHSDTKRIILNGNAHATFAR